MNKCNPCLCTLTLPTCFDTLVVGTVGAANTAYKVYIEDSTIKKLIQYSATSSAGSIISISITNQFAEKHSYSLWVTLATATSDEVEDVLISGANQNHTCFDLKFETIKNSDGDLAEFTSVTLKKDSCCEETSSSTASDDCCDVIELTVAQAQALAATNAFSPTGWYIITNPQSSFGVLRIRARDASNLERNGTLIKNTLSFSVDYDLTNDKLRAFNDVIYNNRFTTSADSEGDCITNFPFNNSNYNNNNGDDFFISIDTVANATISRTDFGKTTIIAITTASGNVTLTDCIFGQLATITLNSASLVKCTVGQGIAVVLVPGQSYTDKIVNAFKSNFDRARVITGVAVFNFITGGVDEGYVGIFNLTSANASETITSFTNHSYTHEVTYQGQAGKTFTFQHDGVNIICKGAANAVLSTANDYVTFRFVGNTAIEVERGNY